MVCGYPSNKNGKCPDITDITVYVCVANGECVRTCMLCISACEHMWIQGRSMCVWACMCVSLPECMCMYKLRRAQPELCPGQESWQAFHGSLLAWFRHDLFRRQPRQAPHWGMGKKLSHGSGTSIVTPNLGLRHRWARVAGTLPSPQLSWGGVKSITVANCPPASSRSSPEICVSFLRIGGTDSPLLSLWHVLFKTCLPISKKSMDTGRKRKVCFQDA